MSRKNKLKIAFVVDDGIDRSDGVQQYVKTLGSWVKQNGQDVIYLAGETKSSSIDGIKVYSLSKNVSVRFNANRLTIPLLAKNSSVQQVLHNEKADVYHIQIPHSPFMSQKVINSVKSKSVVVGTFHILPAGYLHRIGSSLMSAYYRFKAKDFDKIYAVSPPAREFAKSIFKVDCEVLPNVVNSSKFKNENEPIKGKIVFLGRLVERKGAEQLIRACAVLHERNVDFELVIAGDGPMRAKLERLSSTLGIRDKVVFLGYIDETEKPKLLGSAWIACFPSLYGESFGIVLIEAMSAGSKVVIAGDNPGYSSVFNSRDDQLVDPKDTTAFANKLEQYINDTQKAESANDWQSSHVKQFDVDVVGPKLLDSYHNLLENKQLS